LTGCILNDAEQEHSFSKLIAMLFAPNVHDDAVDRIRAFAMRVLEARTYGI
jgi:hypothetical protein